MNCLKNPTVKDSIINNYTKENDFFKYVSNPFVYKKINKRPEKKLRSFFGTFYLTKIKSIVKNYIP